MDPDEPLPLWVCALFVLLMLAGGAAFVIVMGIKLGWWGRS